MASIRAMDGDSTFLGAGIATQPGPGGLFAGFGEPTAGAVEALPAASICARVELIGTHLRAEGNVDQGSFRRLSDYVNFLDGFFTISDVHLLSRTGEATRLTFPDLRVRLEEIAIVGQRTPGEVVVAPDRLIAKQRRRIVITTKAHIVYGYAYIHEQASITAFIDATDPRFIPMTNVRVRWLHDRRLAGRFPFALIHRSHIIAVATEISGGLHLLSGRGSTDPYY